MTSISSATPALTLQNIVYSWPGQAPILHIDHLTIARGEQVFLFGPSGSGKTTLLNIMAGICQPQQGEVCVLGSALSTFSPRRRDRFRAQHIGIIFQQFNLIPYLSVLDNLLLRGEFLSVKPAQLRAQALDLLQQLNMQRYTSHYARQLSVGQQQRVAVARALLGAPQLIIADEPTSALDADNRESFLQLLFASATQLNASIIFVSHDKSLSHRFAKSLDITALNNFAHQGAAC